MTITFSQLGKNGRLGNMLFQIVTTIALAKRNNDNYIFPPWEYEQDFNLHNCFSNNINITKVYTEPFFHYQEIPYKDTKNEVLDIFGFWQSYKYFSDYESFIRNIFEFSFSVEKNYDTASIHIRRGDYVTVGDDYHTNLSYDYYQQAMAIVNTKRYMIFSDDIEWCKTKFIGPQYTFVCGNSPAIDLAIMSACSHNIIANSSFSWWAAWLNKNKNKKIIAPHRWFGPKLPHDTKDLIPENWIKI